MFAPGRYYIGDPSYIVNDDDEWEEFCDHLSFSRYHDGDSFVFKGQEVWVHNTAYGDGSYESNKSYEFPVDTGIIGVIPAEIAEGEGHGGGAFVEFDKPFDTSYDDGTFYIGDLEIYTDPDDEEEYDEEDEWDWE